MNHGCCSPGRFRSSRVSWDGTDSLTPLQAPWCNTAISVLDHFDGKGHTFIPETNPCQGPLNWPSSGCPGFKSLSPLLWKARACTHSSFVTTKNSACECLPVSVSAINHLRHLDYQRPRVICWFVGFGFCAVKIMCHCLWRWAGLENGSG